MLLAVNTAYSQCTVAGAPEPRINVISRTAVAGGCQITGTMTFYMDINNGFKNLAIYLYPSTSPALTFLTGGTQNLPGCTAPQGASNVTPIYALHIEVSNAGVYSSNSFCSYPAAGTPIVTDTAQFKKIIVPFTFTTTADYCTQTNMVQGWIFGTQADGQFKQYQCAQAIFSATTTLPAKFGAMKAISENGKLIVDWQTLMEKDVKEFVVEASKDGKNWHAVGRVNSKALNGTTTDTQSYQLVVNSSLALGAISLALLLLIPSFRSRLLRAALGVVVIVMVVAACSKQDKVTDVKNSETMFVRIAQYDINSTQPAYSKAILVVKQ